MWVEKDWSWGAEQEESFRHIKKSITENAMAGADQSLQLHLATDASISGLGGALFQIHDTTVGTEVSPKVFKNVRFIMFLSYKLVNAETRYSNSERECLSIVRCLVEVRWLVIGNQYPVLAYTDHQALTTILTKGQEGHG